MTQPAPVPLPDRREDRARASAAMPSATCSSRRWRTSRGDFEEGVRLSNRVLAVRGQVVPVAPERAHPHAELATARSSRASRGSCARAASGGSGSAPPRSRPAPRRSRPSAPPTSSCWARAACTRACCRACSCRASARRSRPRAGLRVFVGNVATQPGETEGYTLSEHLAALNAHDVGTLIDVVLANDDLDARAPEDYPAPSRSASTCRPAAVAAAARPRRRRGSGATRTATTRVKLADGAPPPARRAARGPPGRRRARGQRLRHGPSVPTPATATSSQAVRAELAGHRPAARLLPRRGAGWPRRGARRGRARSPVVARSRCGSRTSEAERPEGDRRPSTGPRRVSTAARPGCAAASWRRVAEPGAGRRAPRARRPARRGSRCWRLAWPRSGCRRPWRVRRGRGVVTWKSTETVVDVPALVRRVGERARARVAPRHAPAPRPPEPRPQRRDGQPAPLGRLERAPARDDRGARGERARWPTCRRSSRRVARRAPRGSRGDAQRARGRLDLSRARVQRAFERMDAAVAGAQLAADARVREPVARTRAPVAT